MHPATVAVISGSFGSGHDVAARELGRRLADRGFAVRHHDFVDLLGPRLGRLVRGLYARQLTYVPASWGWALDALGGPGGVETATRACVRAAGGRLADAVAGVTGVVSTYPLASLALGRLRRDGLLDAPVTTFLTDLSVHPLWISPDVDLHLAPHALAAAEATRAGAARVRLTAPAVDPDRFRPVAAPIERAALRLRWGLPAGRLALVSSGSWGVGAVAAIARDIARTGTAVPVVACGRNEALRRYVARRGYGPALGWVDDMPSLIRACDVVVTNAGGLTGLEAMACATPVVAYRALPGHGAANARALHDAGLGTHATDRAELAAHLRDPRPRSTSPYAVAAPSDVYRYPDPADLIAATMGRLTLRRPLVAVA